MPSIPDDAKPPVFLDRDGTLIVEKHYLSDPQKVSLEIDVVAGLLDIQGMGHPLFVVSNQSGIGRGIFSDDDARRVNRRTDELLRESGITVTAWYYCPHAPDTNCECRKPLPGMARCASREWGVQLSGSYVIGDKASDLELADAIGGTGILVTTGHGQQAKAQALHDKRPVFGRLTDAAGYIRCREAAQS